MGRAARRFLGRDSAGRGTGPREPSSQRVGIGTVAPACALVQEARSATLDAETTPLTETEIARHLALCPACRAFVPAPRRWQRTLSPRRLRLRQPGSCWQRWRRPTRRLCRGAGGGHSTDASQAHVARSGAVDLRRHGRRCRSAVRLPCHTGPRPGRPSPPPRPLCESPLPPLHPHAMTARTCRAQPGCSRVYRASCSSEEAGTELAYGGAMAAACSMSSTTMTFHRHSYDLQPATPP